MYIENHKRYFTAFMHIMANSLSFFYGILPFQPIVSFWVFVFSWNPSAAFWTSSCFISFIQRRQERPVSSGSRLTCLTLLSSINRKYLGHRKWKKWLLWCKWNTEIFCYKCQLTCSLIFFPRGLRSFAAHIHMVNSY